MNGDDWQQSRQLGDHTIVLAPVYSIESDEPGPPSAEVAALAVLVLERLPELLEAGVRALWQDITGTGPVRSGMWWHNDPEEAFEHVTTPSDETGLYALLTARSVTVGQDHASMAPVARIQFDAEFEEEHGVSFLTDGTAIIGVGYAHSSSPFRPK